MRTEEQTPQSRDQPTDSGSSSVRAIICEETARICVARYGKSLRAVVLSGSLARNEATLIEANASWRLLGDADFFMVFHDTERQPSASTLEATRREVESALSGNRVIGHIGLQAVSASYLQRRPRHIEPFELRRHGYVIWGDRDVLSLIPDFSADQIQPEDAWRLLANRIVELLEAFATASEPGDAAFENTFYRMIKLYLDMATSYLVFAGHYNSTYRERSRTLSSLADAPDQVPAPFPLAPFADRVRACTRFKLEGRAIEAGQADLLKDAIHLAHLLWRWELTQLSGHKRQLGDAELMRHWMEQQPIKARVRGWVSVVRRSGWHRSWREWPRWIRLGHRASPRYWIYSTAADVLFSYPFVGEAGSSEDESAFDWSRFTCRMPLQNPTVSDADGVAWRPVARLTAVNYHLFVEPTTA